MDNALNILSNKLTALYRFEPKDIADIWIISKNMKFQWKEMIQWAKEKELGLDLIKISEIVRSFPPHYFDAIKWALPVDKNKMMEELEVVADEPEMARPGPGRSQRIFAGIRQIRRHRLRLQRRQHRLTGRSVLGPGRFWTSCWRRQCNEKTAGPTSTSRTATASPLSTNWNSAVFRSPPGNNSPAALDGRAAGLFLLTT